MFTLWRSQRSLRKHNDLITGSSFIIIRHMTWESFAFNCHCEWLEKGTFILYCSESITTLMYISGIFRQVSTINIIDSRCFAEITFISLIFWINICFWATELEIGDLSSKAYPSSSHNSTRRILSNRARHKWLGSYSIYKICLIDIADPSIMLDACHMNFVIDLAINVAWCLIIDVLLLSTLVTSVYGMFLLLFTSTGSQT